MKSKSLLINYSGYPTTPNAFMPDNGLAVLAGSLISSGHETTIMDYNTLDVMQLLPQKYGERLLELQNKTDENSTEELKQIAGSIALIQEKDITRKADELTAIIKEKGIDFLGFKLWTGNGFKNNIKLAAEIKKRNPSLPLFAGGPHVDYFRERIYKVTDLFDALVYGEGEETIVALAEYVIGKGELSDINNLVLKEGDRVYETPQKRLTDLNVSFPVYDDDVYPAMKGDGKLKIFIAEFSRGCPNKCNFCGHSNKSGLDRRNKTSENIIREFNYISETHGTRVFRNGDSNTPGSVIQGVAEKILEDGLDVEYALISHVNNLKKEFYELLKESGCFSIFFGIESGNQRVLDEVINKGLDLNKAKEAIREAKEKGLFVVTSFVYPTPGETAETAQDTYEFIKETRPDVATFCPPIVTPKSTWGDYPEKFGIELGEGYFDDLMLFTPALFYPPTMWQPMNYKINGKDFFTVAKESDSFAKALEEDGVLTQVMEDAALMARHCDLGYSEFRDNVRRYLTVGDQENMQEIVRKINSSVLVVNKVHAGNSLVC